jgi:hypothetical protein
VTTVTSFGRYDDQHSYEDEYGRPDETVKGQPGVVILYEEEAADKNE